MVSFDLQTVLPCLDSGSSSTQRLSAVSSVIRDEDKAQKLNTLQYSSQIIRKQTYKSPMLEDSSEPATAHVRQKPTESFERSGGARAPVLRSDLVLLILL